VHHVPAIFLKEHQQRPLTNTNVNSFPAAVWTLRVLSRLAVLKRIKIHEIAVIHKWLYILSYVSVLSEEQLFHSVLYKTVENKNKQQHTSETCRRRKVSHVFLYIFRSYQCSLSSWVRWSLRLFVCRCQKRIYWPTSRLLITHRKVLPGTLHRRGGMVPEWLLSASAALPRSPANVCQFFVVVVSQSYRSRIAIVI